MFLRQLEWQHPLLRRAWRWPQGRMGHPMPALNKGSSPKTQRSQQLLWAVTSSAAWLIMLLDYRCLPQQPLLLVHWPRKSEARKFSALWYLSEDYTRFSRYLE
jgi:hypothetical protein